jgi:hypothetical protein
MRKLPNRFEIVPPAEGASAWRMTSLAAERGEMNRQLFEEASQASAPGF